MTDERLVCVVVIRAPKMVFYDDVLVVKSVFANRAFLFLITRQRQPA
jgi:hypothetical protein